MQNFQAIHRIFIMLWPVFSLNNCKQKNKAGNILFNHHMETIQQFSLFASILTQLMNIAISKISL